MAMLGLAAVGGIALAVAENSTSTSPAPVPARSEPLPPRDSAPARQFADGGVFAWCMRGVDCPEPGAAQTPTPGQDEARVTPVD